MPPLLIVIFAVAGWIALTLGLKWAGFWLFSRGPGGDSVTGLMVLATQVYSRLMHRASTRDSNTYRKRVNRGA